MAKENSGPQPIWRPGSGNRESKNQEAGSERGWRGGQADLQMMQWECPESDAVGEGLNRSVIGQVCILKSCNCSEENGGVGPKVDVEISWERWW